MLKGYFAAAVLLVLGLAGVGTLAFQASQRQGEAGGKTKASSDQKGAEGPEAMKVALGPEARDVRPARLDPGAVRTGPIPTTPDTGGARPDPVRPAAAAAAPDGGLPAETRPAPGDAPREAGMEAGQEAGMEAGREAPREAAPADGPPRPDGPEPVLVVEFEESSSKTSAADLRRVREVVDKHGYKDLRYLVTGYAGELPKARRNKTLARQRCQQVSALLRKRGVSRRWLSCQDPVFRDKDGAPTVAHRAPAWRRVEVRVTK